MVDANHIRTLGDYSKPSYEGYRNTIELPVGNNVNQVQRLMEAHLAPTQPTQVNKITTSCDICSGPHDTQYCMEDPEQAFVDYASSRTNETGSRQERLSSLRTQLEQQQDNIISKINLLWKAVSEKLDDTPIRDTVGNPATQMNFTSTNDTTREELRGKGIKIILKKKHEAKEEGNVKTSKTEYEDHEMTMESEEEFEEKTEDEIEEEEEDSPKQFDTFLTMKELREEGTITFEKDKEKIVFKMPHKMEMFKHIDFTDMNTDRIPPFVIEGDDDSSRKTYYSDSLDLGPEYKHDKNVCRAIRSLLAMKAKRNIGEVTTVLHMAPPDPNNTYIQPPSEIQILEFIKTLGYDEDPETNLIVVSKMVATRLHQPWRAILSSKLNNSQDDHPITKLLSTTKGEYKFGMEVPDAMISDVIKKKVGHKYYMAKKVESEKAKIVDELEEQHISPIKSGRGKGFICYGDQVVNVPNKLKKDHVPRKTRSLTIAEEAVVVSRLESLRQKKQPTAGEGSSVSHKKYYDSSDTDSDATLYSSSSDESEESTNETDDADESDINLSNENPQGDDDDASLTVTNSSLDFIQTLLDETPANELMDFMSHPVYIDAHTTSVVHNPEGNPELTNYISGAFEVPLGTHVDVLATKTLMQEMFPDKNSHHIPSLPVKKIPNHTTTPQPNSLQAKAKKLMQQAKKNMRKFNFKKALAHKFKEYDQKLEALTNFNVSEAFEKAVQAKGENKKKCRKNVGKPSSRSSRRNRSLVVIVQEGIEDRIPERWSKEVRHYHFKALNGIHHWEEDIIDLFKTRMSAVTEGNVYSDLRIKSVVRIVVKKKWGYGFLTSIVVRRSDDKEYEFIYADLPRLSVNDVEYMYLLQVQDKLHHLPLEFVKEFNNALLMFIRRTMIKNWVEDIQLGVESYQRTLNLTKPTMFFEGIDQRIPFMMIATHKGVVYLNQYNIKSLMKLSEVKKFSDGTLVKIQENLIDMLSKNKLSSGNKRLKGRDWTDYDFKSLRESLKKFDEILRHRGQLRRLEEYIGGRPKTINPRTFVRPL
ncbi:hypothetical protein Tco_0320313 [Tanacetum coccineum]